jgi:hypothetical protein
MSVGTFLDYTYCKAYNILLVEKLTLKFTVFQIPVI